MNVTRITVGRLYNLGSYEHVRYEISVELKEGENAQAAMVGVEKIMAALAPESKCFVYSRDALARERFQIEELHKLLSDSGPEVFVERKMSHFAKSNLITPEEYIAKAEQEHADNAAKREAYEKRAEMARAHLNAVGGAAQWKDAKLDWELDNDF